MINYKGKGLTPDQYEKFLKNEESFNHNYLEYMKSLSNPREIEYAQLKRKYQSSFSDEGNFCGIFTHKFSNPDEFNENLSRSIKKSGALDLSVCVPEDFEDSGCKAVILSEINEDFREELEKRLQNLSAEYKSLFKALKFVDSHIQFISDDIVFTVSERARLEKKAQLEKLLQISRAAKGIVKIPDSPPAEDVKVPEKEAQELPSSSKNSTDHKKNEKDQSQDSESDSEISKEEVSEEENFSDPARASEKVYKNVRVTKKAVKINAKQMTFKGLGSAHLLACLFEVQCERCQNRIVTGLSLDSTSLELGSFLFSKRLECSCTLPIFLEITPKIIFVKSGKELASGKFEGCHPFDIIEMDLKFTCPDCGEVSKYFQIRQFVPYPIKCSSCFSSGLFQLNGINFADVEKNTEEKESGKNNFIGKPLPKNGVCKHFKSSFRWFKFPCCQRLFPCMICHDDNSQHPSQRSELYVCGFCGSLQKFSNKDVCKQCGASVNGLDGNKKFWEGGKGCRNTAKMSRNDKKKFKLKK